MKRHYHTALFSLLFIVYGCAESYEWPREIDPKDYNLEIATGIEANSEWAKSPQGIAERLFPRDAHQEGNGFYSIVERRWAETVRKVTVIEEGPFDDEVYGEKAIIDFKFKKDRWKITRMYISIKRRF